MGECGDCPGQGDAAARALVRGGGGVCRVGSVISPQPACCHAPPHAHYAHAQVDSGVSRVVMGMEHPLPHAHGAAVAALRSAGLAVGEWLWLGLKPTNPAATLRCASY